MSGYTQEYWSGTAWLKNASNQMMTYDADGIMIQWVEQKVVGTSFVDTLRHSYTPTGVSYDCNGYVTTWKPEDVTKEVWSGTEWIETDYDLYNDWNWGEKLISRHRAYNKVDDEFTSGSLVTYKWNYDIDYWYSYYRYYKVWNATDQEWVNDYFYEIGRDALYMGLNEFDVTGSNPSDADFWRQSYHVEKGWDNVNDEWVIYRLDTTIYNRSSF